MLKLSVRQPCLSNISIGKSIISKHYIHMMLKQLWCMIQSHLKPDGSRAIWRCKRCSHLVFEDIYESQRLS